MSKMFFKKQQGSSFLSPYEMQLFKKEQIDLIYLCSYCSSKFYSPESRESKFNNVISQMINMVHKIVKF